MFRDIVQPAAGVGARKKYVVPLSIVTHIILIAIAIMVPLFAPGVLPAPAATLIASWRPVSPDDVPLPPSPPSRQPGTQPAAPNTDPAVAPVVAPPGITPEPAAEPAATRVAVVEGVGSGLSDLLGRHVESVPPPQPPSAQPIEPVHIGGRVKRPSKVNDVPPIYPSIAQQVHVEGMVIIEATIGTDGHVVDTRVLRSVPLLDAAAVDAVRQWQYTPTLLNGIPVPVVMTVTVNFTLR